MLQTLASWVPRRWLSRVSSWQFQNRALYHAIQFGAGMFRGRDGIIQRGAGRGLRFNTTANLGYLFGTSEPHVQQALTELLKPGDVLYDIGANVGFFAIIGARLVTNAGRVECFEPVEANVRQVEHNAQINGFTHVRVFPWALSDEEGEVSFAVSSEPTLGRIVDGQAQLPREHKGITKVRARRLDDVAREESLAPPNLILMDVEGAEAKALLGGEKLIRAHRPTLLIELHGTQCQIAELLSHWDYRAEVIGSPGQQVRDAVWNAHVLAVSSGA